MCEGAGANIDGVKAGDASSLQEGACCAGAVLAIFLHNPCRGWQCAVCPVVLLAQCPLQAFAVRHSLLQAGFRDCQDARQLELCLLAVVFCWRPLWATFFTSRVSIGVLVGLLHHQALGALGQPSMLGVPWAGAMIEVRPGGWWGCSAVGCAMHVFVPR